MNVLIIDTRFHDEDGAGGRDAVANVVNDASACIRKWLNRQCLRQESGITSFLQMPNKEELSKESLALICCMTKTSRVFLKPPYSLHKAYEVLDWMASLKPSRIRSEQDLQQSSI